jgi:hypothetical protein
MPGDPNQPRDSRGRWTKGKAAGGVLGLALLASLMSAAGGGDAVTSIGAGLDAAASQTAVDQSVVDEDTASSRKAATKGDETDAWQRIALKKLKQQVKRELRCAVQSFGQVQQFFIQHPCDRLQQYLFPLIDTHGDIIVCSVMWVTLSSDTTATEFERLEDTYGTGDVTPFGTELLQLGGIHFTGKHYRSRPDGKLVVIAETEPARGQPSNLLLQEVATIADVLPPPP